MTAAPDRWQGRRFPPATSKEGYPMGKALLCVGLARPGHEGPRPRAAQRLAISPTAPEAGVVGDMRSCRTAKRRRLEHPDRMREPPGLPAPTRKGGRP